LCSARVIQLPIYSESARFEVDRAVGRTQFACDLTHCKGACCTMPADAGAPILESEIAELERVYPIVKKYLSDDAIAIIERKGVYEHHQDSLTIPAVRGRDCVFVTYEGDIALCAIEKAHRAGEVKGFPKPISCHLFPIRIYPQNSPASEAERKRRGLGGGVSTAPETFDIVYEEISECSGGKKRGKRERIPLIDFLESPLVRALGEERVERLRQAFTKN
jgi:hypothetical protein